MIYCILLTVYSVGKIFGLSNAPTTGRPNTGSHSASFPAMEWKNERIRYSFAESSRDGLDPGLSYGQLWLSDDDDDDDDDDAQ